MYDVTPDGSRFLVLRRFTDEERDDEIVVSLNWFRELRRLMRPR